LPAWRRGFRAPTPAVAWPPGSRGPTAAGCSSASPGDRVFIVDGADDAGALDALVRLTTFE
jgi:hypothetical protein